VYFEENSPRRALGQKETDGQFAPVDNMSVFGGGESLLLLHLHFYYRKMMTLREKKETKEERLNIPLPMPRLSHLISRCLANFVQQHLV
jgi:hypothetical protein